MKYKCKENDSRLKFIEEDGLIDEVWVGTSDPKDGWTVVGWDDLKYGIELAQETFTLKTWRKHL